MDAFLNADVIDRAYFDSEASLLGEDVMRQVIDLFIEQVGVIQPELAFLSLNDSPDKCVQLPHQLASMSGSLGLQQLYVLCSSIQDVAKQGDEKGFQSHLSFLSESVDRSVEALRNIYGAGVPTPGPIPEPRHELSPSNTLAGTNMTIADNEIAPKTFQSINAKFALRLAAAVAAMTMIAISVIVGFSYVENFRKWRLEGELSSEVAVGAAMALVFVTAVVAVAIFVHRRTVTRPLESLHDAFLRVDTTSKLIEKIDGHTDDEFGRIVDAYNVLAKRLLDEETILRSAKETADRAVWAQSTFLANVSHEIRTPMNAIIGLSDLANEEEMSEKLKWYLERMDASAHTLLAIINDILDLSKIEAGKMDVENSVFGVQEVVENLSALFSYRAAEKNIQFQCITVPPVPPLLVGDPIRLGQVLSNLVGNAIKFTNTGGVEVFFDCTEAPDGKIDLRVEVKDTGIGIGKLEQDKIFRPFEQLEIGAGHEFGGTGLGLSISQALVDVMGGEIQVRNNPGAGTTFWFSIPTERTDGDAYSAQMNNEDNLSHSYSTDRGRVVPPVELNARRVLLVEDLAMNQFVITEILKKAGVDVTVADHGIDAIDILEQNAATGQKFDAILMDIEMPRMDGFQTTRIIRQNPKMEKLPIIALSAHVAHEQRKVCLHVGMNDYISKPINRRHLYAVLTSVIDNA